MNRGTALKWIQEIESGKYLYGNGQLRFWGQECRTSYSQRFASNLNYWDPFGVLLNFLNPDGWQRHPILFWSFAGEVFKMPEEYRRKCKMKTVWGDFVTSNGINMSLRDIIDGSNSFDLPLYYIKTYYEQF